MNMKATKSKHDVLAFFMPKSCPLCPFLPVYNIVIPKERGKAMVKTEERLKKEVCKLYLFANLMYGDVLDGIGKKKKTIGFEEERLLEHVKKSVESYFKDFKIDENLFKDFNERQSEHLGNLSKNIDDVQENVIENIIQEIFTPLGDDETIVEKQRSLELATERIINAINDSIESINRQIGYCMVLYSYENKGYRKYRLKAGSTACEECKEKGIHTYPIDKLNDAEFLPLVHPNCRCTIEILDEKNKAVATIDSKAIEEQLGKTESTKGMGFLDYVSALLSAAALIPGIDSIVDLISIPVDLLRGDLISAGFDLLGIVPFVGEIGDAGKALRIADKAIDGAKFVDKTLSFSDFPKKLHLGKQGKHIVGHNNYQKGKSILEISIDEAQDLINQYSGKGQRIDYTTERVDFKKVIGKYVDEQTEKMYETTVGTIRYSKNGVHIVPARPREWRK